jgi:hypothetical protein
MERKIFWTTFAILGLAADFVLPLWWALCATIPICFVKSARYETCEPAGMGFEHLNP